MSATAAAAAATKSRPRPRPRPRPRQAAKSETAVATSDANPSSPVRASSLALEDEDALFIRNRGRGAKAWKELDKAVDKVEKKRETTVSDSDSESENSDPVFRNVKMHKKHKKRFVAKKPKELPEWTKDTGKSTITILDSDEEKSKKMDLLRCSSSSRGSSLERTPNSKGKGKRLPSRSPSLTPPPVVTEAEQKKRRDLVAQVLNSMSPPRPPITTIRVPDDNDADEIQELDPELARIAARIKTQPLNNKTMDESTNVQVELRIRLLPHPEDESGRVQIFSFEMGRNESFEDLFGEIADQLGVLVNRVIVTHNSKRVFASSSPATLSIWSAAELEACEEHIYEYIKEQQNRARSVTPLPGAGPSLTNTPDPGRRWVSPAGHSEVYDSGAGANPDAPEPEPDKSNVFKLRLRSGDKLVQVSVRPTTKCGTIVATFVKKIGLTSEKAKQARIEIDGEAMSPDTEIGDADLEDGDLVDIVGL